MSPLVALLAFQGGDPYVPLAASLPPAAFERAMATIARPPEGTTALEARRAAAERWNAVLKGLRAASDADYRPRAWRPEEIEGVGRLARLVVEVAYVRFADGERAPATTLLLDGLTMARRVGSASAESAIVAAFAEHLPAMSFPQCERARAALDAHLAARDDRRLRLLRLHLRVEAYRWRYLKPPSRLADAAPPAETIDPVSRRSFRYEADGAGYRLWGENGPEGGRFELGTVGKP